MAYHPTPSQVRKNRELLDTIAKALAADAPLPIEPGPGQTQGALRYQIRNVLKSAAKYPQEPYDEDLDSQITLSTTHAPGKITVMPSQYGKVEVSSASPEIDLPGLPQAMTKVYRAKESPVGESGTIKWQADGGDREKFESMVSDIQGIELRLQDTQEIDSDTILTYAWRTVRSSDSDGTPSPDEYDPDSDPYASVLDKYSD